MPRALQEKILSLTAAVQAAEALRADHKRVVWTNGCFDLLHAGHVNYLQAARQLGDWLIVGVNSDASVEGLKGPGRPIVPLAARQQVLAALEAVDAVVAFGEATPLKCIVAIRPNLIVKGGDYKAEQVVGANEAKAWGGAVKIVPLIAGWSTSKIAKSLQRA